MAFENEMDTQFESPLTPTPGESDELESEEDREVSAKVRKPPGTVGCPQSGGYNLQDKLGWNDITYQSILVSLFKVSTCYKHSEKITDAGAQTGKDEVRHC